MKMKYKEWNAELRLEEYVNGGYALELYETEDDYECITTCSVYLDGVKEDEIAIKDNNENEGMVNFLVENNILELPHREIQSGYVSFPVLRFATGALEQLKNV